MHQISVVNVIGGMVGIILIIMGVTYPSMRKQWDKDSQLEQ